YYWMFSQFLDWGYFDHPPMTPLLIHLGNLISSNELGVRIIISLLQPIYLFLFWVFIKRDDFTAKDATLYFLVAISIPLLEMNGFIATPDAPLMFFTVIFLGCFEKYRASNSYLWSVLTGVSMALLAYSKYHGAIVVICTLAANIPILKRPKTYLAALTAILLLSPHFIWQYQNDFASFKYHLSDRNKSFKASYLFEYIGNMWVTLNPFLFPVFLSSLVGNRTRTPFERTIKFLSIGFLLFFGLSAIRGHVQPQWILPASLGVIFWILLACKRTTKKYDYVFKASVLSITLILLIRLNLIFNWVNIPAMGFDNKADMLAIKEIAKDKPVVMKSSYSRAALYNFYTGGTSNSQQEWSHRSSQYQLWDIDSEWYNKAVVIEVAKGDSAITLPSGKTFNYIINEHYVPTHKLEAEWINPITHLNNDSMIIVETVIRNPYPFDIRLGQDANELDVDLVIHKKKEIVKIFSIADREITVPAKSEIQLLYEWNPNDKFNGDYDLSYWIKNKPMESWWANKNKYKITFEN
ncbi:MAG: ArnT family glycosyltransferase, partial [Bacteroidales bacterium]